MGRIQSLDYRILALIQRRMRCKVLDKMMPGISAVGNNGYIWIALAFLFICIRHYRICGYTMMGAILICAVICNLIIKPAVARFRPCHTVSSMPLLIRRPTDYSFPSGHTISSFAAAMVLFHFHYIIGIAAFVLAFLIAFSRVYLFVHYPTDVLVGACLGMLISWGVLILTSLVLLPAIR